MPRDETRIYVGNLPSDARERDIEDVFTKYGSIKFVDIKGGRGPLYAFLEFNDPRDAEDAVRGRNGYDFDGRRLRVEFTRGSGGRGGPSDRGGRHNSDDRGGSFNRRGAHPSKRTKNRVIIEGLPPSGSWQDLKDHMREAGEVCYADVSKDGTGVVEFARYEDVKYAIRKLDDTKFRSHEGETTYIKVKEDNTGGRRSRSRSPRYSPRNSRSRSRSKSRSRSVSRSKSRSKSPSRSRSASRSRSVSRSRSRSP